MRRAVRELLEAADRLDQRECPGEESCSIFEKKEFCPEYCPCVGSAEVDPYYQARFQRASETLLEIEHLGLRWNDLEWQEIQDLKIVVTERNAFLNRKIKDQKGART